MTRHLMSEEGRSVTIFAASFVGGDGASGGGG
jgi:hypothetical protein